MTGKIYYHCRDWPAPAGGIRRLYRHVEILTNHGFEAAILHQAHGFRLDWFKSSAPVEYWQTGMPLSSDDVLVIPEGHTDIMRRTIAADYRRIVIALNWSRIFPSLSKGENWRTFNISSIIAGSNYEHDFIMQTMGLDSTVIASGIDANLFAPATQKQTCIAYMPAKGTFYSNLISSAFYSRFPRLHDIPFIPINGVPHETVATILARSGLFLAHTFPEGLSRKMLEAMACGCIVVGFAGGGSTECMEHLSNCYLAPDADVLLAVEYLGQAVHDCINGTAWEMREQARATARRYSLEREEAAVVKFWQDFSR